MIEDPGTGSACANLGGWLLATGATLPQRLARRPGRSGRPALPARSRGRRPTGGSACPAASSSSGAARSRCLTWRQASCATALLQLGYTRRVNSRRQHAALMGRLPCGDRAPRVTSPDSMRTAMRALASPTLVVAAVAARGVPAPPRRRGRWATTTRATCSRAPASARRDAEVRALRGADARAGRRASCCARRARRR